MNNYVNRDEALDAVELHSDTLMEAGNRIRNLEIHKKPSDMEIDSVLNDIKDIRKAMSEAKGHLIYNPLISDIESKLAHIEDVLVNGERKKNE